MHRLGTWLVRLLGVAIIWVVGSMIWKKHGTTIKNTTINTGRRIKRSAIAAKTEWYK